MYGRKCRQGKRETQPPSFCIGAEMRSIHDTSILTGIFAVKFPTKKQLCWLQQIIFCKLCVFAPVFMLMPLITILLWKKPTRQFTTKAFSPDGAMQPQSVHHTDFTASVSFSCAGSEGHFAKKLSHRWHRGKCFRLAFGDRIHDVRIKRWL